MLYLRIVQCYASGRILVTENSMNIIPFAKMQGAGNDYVYINGFKTKVASPGALAKKISDRHFGIGSDGLVLILPSEQADIAMRMFNADGSEAEMCGNASRCVGKYAWDHGLVKEPVFRLDTRAGEKIIELCFRDGSVWGATVDMGEPVLEPARIPVGIAGTGPVIARAITVNGQEYGFTAVSMGNPHAVVFMTDIDKLDLPVLGPGFENHPLFPRRTNTEFVEVLSRDKIRMRVWERGAGETLACGTGACAALVACCLNGLTNRAAEVELKGGSLRISWNEKNNHIYMTGPAVTVFEGEYFNESE